MEIINVSKKIAIFRAKSLNVNATLVKKKNNYLIDTLLFPRDSKNILKYTEMNKIDIDYIINSHYHSDHCYGNKILKSEKTHIIGNQNYQHTIDSERQLINSKSSRKISKKNITSPDITFDQNYFIKNELEILHTRGHSPDSCSIHFPAEKIIIVGDLVINSLDEKYALPYFYWDNIFDMIKSLEMILHLKIEKIVPGHGKVTSKEKIKTDLEYLYNFIYLFEEYKKKDNLSEFSKIPVETFLANKSLIIWNKDIHKFNVESMISNNK